MTRLLTIAVCAVSCAAAVACGGDSGTNTKEGAPAAYASTTFEPRASMIAVGGTEQLTVVPRGFDGDSLPFPASTEFWSSDSGKVLVTQAGLVSGVAATGTVPVAVMVRVQSGNVTRTDTAYVAVTDVAYQPASLQLTTPYGSQAWLLFGQVTIAPQITAVGGAVVTGVPAYLTTSATALPIQSTSGVAGIKLGPAWVKGTLTAYGVKLTDSVQVKFTPAPFFGSITLDSTAAGQPKSTVAGYKIWFALFTPLTITNNTSHTLTITFTGPAPVPADVTIAPGTAGYPIFMTEGDYTWTVQSAPTVSGTISIQ